MNCTVSVIIPVFNGAGFIARAIDSALGQSHPPLEIIVVNDGSLDNTAEVLAGFGARIRLITVPNGGVAQARNIGMQASCGDLIAFLDADDIWHRTKLEVQVAALRAHPTAGFCCCDYLQFNRRLGRRVHHFAQFYKDPALTFDRPLHASPLTLLIKFNFVGTSSNVMIKRSVMRQVGLFNVAYRQAEDYDYWLRCARSTVFLVLSAALMEKTAHETNLTNNLLETFLFHEKVLLALHPRQLTMDDALARQMALAAIRYEIANRWWHRGDFWKTFFYCIKGLRSQRSFANIRLFAALVCKKTVRLMSNVR